MARLIPVTRNVQRNAMRGNFAPNLGGRVLAFPIVSKGHSMGDILGLVALLAGLVFGVETLHTGGTLQAAALYVGLGACIAAMFQTK